MNSLGELISNVRKERGYTQDQLASLMNVSRQTVSHWENGRILPDIESVIQLSQVLQYDFLADSKEIMSDAGETGEIVASFTDETLP